MLGLSTCPIALAIIADEHVNLLLCLHFCVMQSVTKDAAGQVTGVSAELNLAGDFKKTKLKLTWLADVPDLVPLTLTEFDYLITKKKVGGLFSCLQPGLLRVGEGSAASWTADQAGSASRVGPRALSRLADQHVRQGLVVHSSVTALFALPIV